MVRFTTCNGRPYQLPGFPVARNSPNSLKLALSTDHIASGVDSDRGGSYASLITNDSVVSGIDSDRGGPYVRLFIADSVASGVDSDRGGGRASLLTRDRIGPTSSSERSVTLLLVPYRV